MIADLTKFLFLMCVVSSLISATDVTPMQKVVGLLQDLSAKLEAEGKEEAAQYDKYACFCKDQKSEKEYAMAKSNDKIEYLGSEIEELSAAKTDLEGKITDLHKDIQDHEVHLELLKAKRDADHKAYLVEVTDVREAIDSSEAALDALTNSKKEMRGARVDLVQVTSGLVKAVKNHPLLQRTPGAVALLSKLDQRAAPNGFEYQGNEIITLIQDVKAKFKSVKKEVDVDEGNSNAMYERVKLSVLTAKKLAEKQVAEAESIVEAKTDELHEAKGSKGEEELEREADTNFLTQLEGECKSAGAVFDDRSSVRAAELTSITEATGILQKEAAPRYDQQKKVGMMPPFGGVQISKVGRTGKTLSEGPVTLVQINNVQYRASSKSKGEGAIQRVRSFLTDAADRYDSSALSAIAVRVAVSHTSADHFVKVRELIQNLLSKLESDASAESTQKITCDGGIKAATGQRDELNAKIEASAGKIEVLQTKISQVNEETQDKHAQIAELQKALLERTELFETEKAQLAKDEEEFLAGADAVEWAQRVLHKFYGGDEPESMQSMLQTAKYVPDGAGRDGQTTGDLAPEGSETFTDSYKGAHSESKGIMGILDVIHADFDRSKKQAKVDRDDLIDDFKEFNRTTRGEMTMKNEKVTANELVLTELDGDLLEEKNTLDSCNGLLAKVSSKLDGWHELCVKGEETYSERTGKRDEEIEALKQAGELLEEWQS
jgi:hypothetical protein